MTLTFGPGIHTAGSRDRGRVATGTLLTQRVRRRPLLCDASMTEQRLLHWRGFGPDRFEAAHVVLETGSLLARGTSLTSSYSLDYELVTEAQWVTRELTVRVHEDTSARTLVLARAADGAWTTDYTGAIAEQASAVLPDLSDALDCDLALCPLTNTMPILRNDLVGRSRRREAGAFDCVMAWVSVPDLIVHRSEQRYSVSDPVEGRTGALVHFSTKGFRTTLEVDGDGLVVNYPGLARMVERIS
jgi:uncharacterized protein